MHFHHRVNFYLVTFHESLNQSNVKQNTSRLVYPADNKDTSLAHSSYLAEK